MSQTRSRLSGGVFHELTLDEFRALLRAVSTRRTIDAIHLHHTWIPRQEQFRGVSTIAAMWRHHTQKERWSDIAQHLTIDAEGGIWTGRHWDLPPASARGHNGSDKSGPFMIEMIGNFDRGENELAEPQRGVVLAVLALLLERFGLPTSAIRFHNEMSPKTCPGTGIDRASLLQEIEPLRGAAAPPEAAGPSPFSEEEDAVWQAIAFLRTGPPAGARALELRVEETYDAEPAESDAAEERLGRAVSALEAGARGARDLDVTLTPVIREALRPHVVNLTRGKFSSTGEFTTSKEDVDAIFDEHLPKALAARDGDPLRIVVYAHGGLVGEMDGLGVALKHVDWWKANDVYPIYFVWETDFLTSLMNAISGAMGGRAVARDGTDVVDAQIEAAARRFKANSIWADMKHVARLSSEPDGGAAYVAKRLAQFCGAHGADVEVHAVGHSAGSNFNSFFIPVALDAGVPSFKTLQLLAPAITVDSFFATLGRRLGQIGSLTIFTMKDPFEQGDHCARVYNKSLLYLIYHALEETRETDLLGLEISVRRDLRLRRLLGLEGRPHPKGHEVIWSIAEGDRRSASGSTSHGGFDDDPATMNSVLRRVLDLTGDDEVVREFVRPARSADVDAWSSPPQFAPAAPQPAAAAAPAGVVVVTSPAGTPSIPAEKGGGAGGRGRRRALCVGINAYKRQPLRGCVADAERWADTLAALGFEVQPLLKDAAATGDRIVGALTDLLQQSRAGDVVVFQYAGHGTTLPDETEDEAGGDSPGFDEALCAYDFTEGRFVVDDELAAAFAAAPPGVQITSFIDCCHSGSITRFGVGPAGGGTHAADERPRFLHALPAEIAAWQARRRRLGVRGARSARAAGPQRDVLFSACRSTEVAWESLGQGDFTRHATSILKRGATLTNAALLEQVQAAFGPAPRQHPELHPPEAAGRALFAPAIHEQ